MSDYPMYIDGQWVDTQEEYVVRAPATGAVTATTAFGGIKHADLTVAAAKRAQRCGSTTGTQASR